MASTATAAVLLAALLIVVLDTSGEDSTQQFLEESGQPTASGLGPQAAAPLPSPGETTIVSDVFELRLQPRESVFVDFPLAHFGSFGEGCSNATCSIHFTWSVRKPYPSNEPLVEFFYERMGAHASLGTSNAGEAAAGYFSPVSVSNRGGAEVLMEVRYILTTIMERQ